MKITPELVAKIAALARLHVEDSEVPSISEKLSAIFGYIEQLEAVDVGAIEPMSHVLEVSNVMREDVALPSMPVEELLSGAPDSSERFIRVPIILEPGESS